MNANLPPSVVTILAKKFLGKRVKVTTNGGRNVSYLVDVERVNGRMIVGPYMIHGQSCFSGGFPWDDYDKFRVVAKTCQK